MPINSVFGFPIEILSGPNGERNFEMYRAEQLYGLTKGAPDLDFNLMVHKLSDPFEINFEMVHMVSYVKKLVHPDVFDCFPSPVVSAEFWLHRFCEETTVINPSLSSGEGTPKLVAPVKENAPQLPVAGKDAKEPKRGSTPRAPKLHRGLPGFDTILHCGATTLGCDASTVPSIVYNTPSSRRIKEMFDCSDSFLPRPMPSETQDHIEKENDPTKVCFTSPASRTGSVKDAIPPRDPRMNRARRTPSIELHDPSDASLACGRPPLSSVTNPVVKKTPTQPTVGALKAPFEVFHDSYLTDSATPASVGLTTVTPLPASRSGSLLSSAFVSEGSKRRPRSSTKERRTSINEPPKGTARPPDIDSMDDTAIFALLDEHLALANRRYSPSRAPILFSTDSPTRLAEELLAKCKPSN